MGELEKKSKNFQSSILLLASHKTLVYNTDLTIPPSSGYLEEITGCMVQLHKCRVFHYFNTSPKNVYGNTSS